MITLYQFPSLGDLPNLSPFCFKVENYLRMAELPFETRNGDPRKGPKGKLPYIEDGDTIVADSDHIIEHLKKRHGDKLDASLGAEQRAQAHLLRRCLEDGYYWVGVYARWIEDDGFTYMRRELFEKRLPPVVRSIVPGLVQRQIRKSLHAQGTGRHSRDEIYAMGKADLDALSTLLGEKPFFLGDAPASIDASAYAFLAVTLWAPPSGSVLGRHIETLPNLVAYCERVKAKYYPG